MIKVLISILNWNTSDSTIQCVSTLLADCCSSDTEVLIRVIDNGSSPTEVNLLRTLNNPRLEIQLNPVNTGFTGGQNANIRYALDNNFDFVWLLNNDTSVPVGTLASLIKHMQSDAECGAISPVIVRLGKPDIVDFCGAAHDWATIDALRPATLAEAPAFFSAHKGRIWAVGTALLIRATTVRQVGMLDDRLFAYYDDDDYGARLMKAGWSTRIALDARVEHACYEGDMYQRPPYFFYLTSRNAVFFAIAHVPYGYRRFLRTRYLTRSFFIAEQLYNMGYPAKAEACLLGFSDGLRGRGGVPLLDRALPFWIQALRPLLRWWNRKRA